MEKCAILDQSKTAKTFTFLSLSQTMKISVSTDKRRTDCNAVCIRFSLQGKTSYLPTGLTSTKPLDSIMFPRSEHNFAKKTARLAELFSACEAWLLDHPDASHEQAREALKCIINPEYKNKYTLVHYCYQYAESLTSASSAALYKRTARMLTDFAPGATFSTADTEFLARFDKWMAEIKQFKTNGRSIIMRCLRAVYNRALDDGLTDKYPFRKFKIKSERTEHRTLTIEELVALRDYPLAGDWREEYRDLFMLSFYLAGINATDLLHLQPNALRAGRLRYTRQKTNHNFDIAIPPQALELINRHRGKDYLLIPLERYSKFSDYLRHWNTGLKKIGHFSLVADKAGKFRKFHYEPVVPADITTYYARHTWATIAAKIGVSRDVIAQCLGHSWADVTAVYIAPDNSAVDAALLSVADYISAQ